MSDFQDSFIFYLPLNWTTQSGFENKSVYKYPYLSVSKSKQTFPFKIKGYVNKTRNLLGFPFPNHGEVIKILPIARELLTRRHI